MASSADFGRPNRSIDASNANAAGTEFAIVGAGRVDISWNKIVSGGVYSALSVSLQLSIDGTNWKSFLTDTATGSDAFEASVVAEAPMFVRAIKNSSTTSSGTPLVTVDIVVRKSS